MPNPPDTPQPDNETIRPGEFNFAGFSSLKPSENPPQAAADES